MLLDNWDTPYPQVIYMLRGFSNMMLLKTKRENFGHRLALISGMLGFVLTLSVLADPPSPGTPYNHDEDFV
jgi:uncharacterized membrane protein HdeD (DUF308 family)